MIDLCLPDSLTPLKEVRVSRIVAEPYNSRVGGRGPWSACGLGEHQQRISLGTACGEPSSFQALDLSIP